MLGITPLQVAECVEKVGVGFMFAPAHHSAMRHAIGPRREMGVRTIFNLLGPLTNPAGVKRLLIGVYDAALCRPVAEVLNRLGAEHVMVVHSDDGLDEISAASATHVTEAKSGLLSDYDISPEDLGLQRTSLEGLEVDQRSRFPGADSPRPVRRTRGPGGTRPPGHCPERGCRALRVRAAYKPCCGCRGSFTPARIRRALGQGRSAG